MLTTIKGIYDNGKIILSEEPPVKTTTEVMVTFLTKEKSEERAPLPNDFTKTGNQNDSQQANSKKNNVVFGSLKGKISVPDDFDEPLDDLKEYM